MGPPRNCTEPARYPESRAENCVADDGGEERLAAARIFRERAPAFQRTITPRGATLASITRAPWASATRATFAFAPGSTRKTTHPPPPAPQALAPLTGARRGRDKAVDQRSRDAGNIAPAKGQSSRISRPVSFQSPLFNGCAHGVCAARDAGEVAVDGTIAIDIALHHLPVVDAGIARLARIDKDETFVQIARVNGQFLADNAGRTEFDGGNAAVHGGVIILCAGGNANDLRLQFWAISRIFSMRSPRPVSLFRAHATEIISAEEPEIPAPAGASEPVSMVRPLSGRKKRTSSAGIGSR